MAIGWHFLYEGAVKVFFENWSSQSYLANTTGAFSPFYHWLAASPAIGVIDWMNITGLILIGLALFLGCFTRMASIAGALLLLLYYFAYPPFGLSLLTSTGEGHLYVVNYQIFEALALALFACRADTGFGIGPWLMRRFKAQASSPAPPSSRREAIKHLASIPALGLMSWGAYANNRRYGIDVMSGATIQLNRQDLSELKGTLAKGKIGKHELSRLILGGNLIGGWSHGRDLLYTDQLFKAYNTERKVYETLSLAEAAGINAINIGFPSNDLLRKYKKATGSRIKVITQIAADVKDESTLFDNLYSAIDYGVDVIQIQGNWVDWMTRDHHIDRIGRLLDKIREEGFTAGLGAHTIDSLIACAEAGIIPDYYMKTMHHDRYWSAHPRENRVPFEQDGPTSLDHNKYHNNLFCPYPDRTAEFVAKSPVPVMGFKVLAAGAIHPKDGIYWAFQHGADFVCVGMFDFQIVEDVNICIDVLAKLEADGARTRAWS
jgi:uncharacterized membrane protein YphA (DoxX/SURF4 family)